jgi:hypothetical protein
MSWNTVPRSAGTQMATIYDYGNGLIEGSWISIRPEPKWLDKEKAKRGESQNREQNELFAIRRAKTQARRLILTLRPTSLGTTTFREKVTAPVATQTPPVVATPNSPTLMEFKGR